MGAHKFEQPQPMHNPLRTYEYVANQSEHNTMHVPVPLMTYPSVPMPVHVPQSPIPNYENAHSSQPFMGHPHAPPTEQWPPMMPPNYPPAVYPYSGSPSPWAASPYAPYATQGPHGNHWVGQSKWDAQMSQMHEAGKKAAAAHEATRKWKPDAEPDDMFWCMSEDGAEKTLLSFATISSFKGKWHRGYNGIAYFVRDKAKKDQS